MKLCDTSQPKIQAPAGPRAKPSKAKQVTRRTPHQSGYDSDSAIQQYYDPPSHRIREASPERWLHNPGGLPDHVSTRHENSCTIYNGIQPHKNVQACRM